MFTTLKPVDKTATQRRAQELENQAKVNQVDLKKQASEDAAARRAEIAANKQKAIDAAAAQKAELEDRIKALEEQKANEIKAMQDQVAAKKAEVKIMMASIEVDKAKVALELSTAKVKEAGIARQKANDKLDAAIKQTDSAKTNPDTAVGNYYTTLIGYFFKAPEDDSKKLANDQKAAQEAFDASTSEFQSLNLENFAKQAQLAYSVKALELAQAELGHITNPNLEAIANCLAEVKLASEQVDITALTLKKFNDSLALAATTKIAEALSQETSVEEVAEDLSLNLAAAGSNSADAFDATSDMPVIGTTEEATSNQ